MKFVPTIGDSIISLDIDLVTTDRAVHVRSLLYYINSVYTSIFY